ncbi:MAG: hypothetical protein ACR2L3_04630 [Actinomycetota bacterium]
MRHKVGRGTCAPLTAPAEPAVALAEQVAFDYTVKSLSVGGNRRGSGADTGR